MEQRRPRQLPAMWKLFLSIMASGLAVGLTWAVFGFCFGRLAVGGALVPYVAGSVLLGLLHAFSMYIFVKAVLRAFVRKLHTLERVVVGTRPPALPSVFRSNEVDEVEQSAARIIAKLDAVRAEAGS